MVLGPGVEVNPVKGDAMRANGNFRDDAAHVAFEAIAIHAKVARGVAQADQAGREGHGSGHSRQFANPPTENHRGVSGEFRPILGGTSRLIPVKTYRYSPSRLWQECIKLTPDGIRHDFDVDSESRTFLGVVAQS